MVFLRSVFFFLTIGAYSLLATPAGWIAFGLQKVTGKKSMRTFARWLNWQYGRGSIYILRLFMNIKCINPGAATGIGPCVIICNHQSILDLFLLGAQKNTQVCPVTKSWPFRLLFPFAPAMLAAGYINTEGRSGEEILAECGELAAQKAALVFYPEGSRSRDGKLGRFHSGAFKCALEENLPVVPMIISGSGKAIRPGNFILNKSDIVVEMLNPIYPEEYGRFRNEPLPHRALSKYIRQLYLLKLEEGEMR